jgi:hypothetical protein
MFELVTKTKYRHLMVYSTDQIVLIGVRDITTPNLVEVPLSIVQNEAEAEGHWTLPRRFEHLHELESTIKEVRLHSPIELKGLVVVDAQSRRMLIHSPGYLQIVRLTKLDLWEEEGQWDEADELQGDIDYEKEKEKCLFELLLLFMQQKSKEQSRNKLHQKGQRKRERQERRKLKANLDYKTQSSNTDEKESKEAIEKDTPHSRSEEESTTSAHNQSFTSNPDTKEEGEEEETMYVDELEFLEYFPKYAKDYLDVKSRFTSVCREIDERLQFLLKNYPSVANFAEQAEKEYYKSVLFVLHKRGYPSTRSFYSDFEAVHEFRVEKVAYYMLRWMREYATRTAEAPKMDGLKYTKWKKEKKYE